MSSDPTTIDLTSILDSADDPEMIQATALAVIQREVDGASRFYKVAIGVETIDAAEFERIREEQRKIAEEHAKVRAAMPPKLCWDVNLDGGTFFQVWSANNRGAAAAATHRAYKQLVADRNGPSTKKWRVLVVPHDHDITKGVLFDVTRRVGYAGGQRVFTLDAQVDPVDKRRKR